MNQKLKKIIHITKNNLFKLRGFIRQAFWNFLSAKFVSNYMKPLPIGKQKVRRAITWIHFKRFATHCINT